jgi:flagellar export protein FliJ
MARAFSFRLDQVLNYRRQLENLSIRKMAGAQARRLQIQSDLTERQGQKDELNDWFSGEERKGAFFVEEANRYNDYLDFLSGQEKNLRLKEREAEVEFEKRRVEAVEAAKKRRLLEGLREKRLSAHEAQGAKEDQAFLDDISSIAFIRRDRASRVRQAFEL